MQHAHPMYTSSYSYLQSAEEGLFNKDRLRIGKASRKRQVQKQGANLPIARLPDESVVSRKISRITFRSRWTSAPSKYTAFHHGEHHSHRDSGLSDTGIRGR